jgi:phage terminase small subunit
MAKRRSATEEAETRLRFAKEFVLTGKVRDSALAVGVPVKSADVTGSRWLRREDVQAEIQRIRGAALARVELRNKEAIATLAQSLEAASGIMSLDPTAILGDDGEVDVQKLKALPEIQRRALALEIQSTTDAEGQAYYKHKIKRDPVALHAARLLVEHHSGALKNPQPAVNVVNLNLPPHLVKEVGKALLSQGVIEGEVVKGGE